MDNLFREIVRRNEMKAEESSGAFKVGDKVKLNFHPFCRGRVIKVIPGAVIGDIKLGDSYICRWNKREYGVSENLAAHYLSKDI